jgi:hypothetical protein
MRYRLIHTTLLFLLALAGTLRAQLSLIAPNGGEKYEMAQPVTVSWSAPGVTTVRLEYSSDFGNTWRVIAASIPAASGSYTFTPVELPTKGALVRIIDADAPSVRDQSDRPFEIMEAPIIFIYSPVSGDNLTIGAQTPITWEASRIAAVDVLFSSDGGTTWSLLASNIQAPQWYYLWTVPNIRTQQGKIRVREVGGPVIGESGLFSIGQEVRKFVRVVQPNGGESYLEGDSVLVRWAFQSVTAVSIYFSSDGGTTWTLIRANAPAGTLQVPWRITSPPGDRYLVRVDAAGGISDTSDATFEVVRRKRPRITVVSPNGGEQLFGGEHDSVRWSAVDITGLMIVEYSIDSGRTWRSIGSRASVGDGSYALDWPVPADPTKVALVRVLNPDAGDTSDAVFEIARREIDPIQVLTPNGGEVWLMGQRRVITWTAPPAVTAVDIDFSTDGGANWQRIDSNVTSAPGAMQYLWYIPTLGLETDAARVRVKNTSRAAQLDISDKPFSIKRGPIAEVGPGDASAAPEIAGVYPNPVADRAEIRWRQRAPGDVEIRFYSADGSRAAVYTAGVRAAGDQRYTLDAAALAPGIYLFEVRSAGTALHGVMAVTR